MKKVGIVTVFTGYNYGSLLQAYASQQVISSLGYDAHLVWEKSGLIKGRDVRIKKLIGMGIRGIVQPKVFKQGMDGYISANQQNFSEDTKEKFIEFTNNYLRIKRFSYLKLKYLANSNIYKAFICGSDQIWNSTAVYVDPLYYLRFAPKNKRIAYAPSFGKNEIPEYNYKKIKRYISEFNKLSVREKQGQKIINSLIGVNPPVLVDPTLLLSGERWLNLTKCYENESYMIVYFLNEPNQETKKLLVEIEQYLGVQVIVLPSEKPWHKIFNRYKYITAGPIEFVSLLANADFICTDSFHGMAFSINLNKKFLVFKREYGNTSDQSSRIISLLNVLGLEKQYVEHKQFTLSYFDEIDYISVDKILKTERMKSLNYLKESIEN